MGPYVPPGHSPPFQVVDDLHHGAWLIIVVALGLVLVLVSFLIRLYVRLALNPPFGKDDYILLGATILAIIQASLLFEACARGLGTSIDLLEDRDVNRAQVLVAISNILYLITLYATKCCVVSIYLRITPQKLHNLASWATLVLCTLWVIPAIFIISIDCAFNRPWRGTGGQCKNFSARWQFIVALDIATELILFGLAVVLLSGLFMSLKRKLTIISAFVFRFPTVIFTVVHIYYIQKHMGSRDPTLNGINSLIWSQVELIYALIACSVFCLRPFMAAVSTNYGTAGDSTLESSVRDASRDKSAASKSGGSANRGTMLARNETVASGPGGFLGDIIPDGGKGTRAHEVKVSVQSPAADEIELMERGSLGSEASARMIIRKDVRYSVQYDAVE